MFYGWIVFALPVKLVKKLYLDEQCLSSSHNADTLELYTFIALSFNMIQLLSYIFCLSFVSKRE